MEAIPTACSACAAMSTSRQSHIAT